MERSIKMKQVYIILADGFEEIEALTVVDILRRGQVSTMMVSNTEEKYVTGAHGIKVETDLRFSEMKEEEILALVLPGGMPGTVNLKENKKLMEMVEKRHKQEELTAAICAAPALIFGDLGLLEGKNATCYPSMEEHLTGAKYLADQKTVQDGHLITGCGMGGAIPFGLQILEALKGKELAKQIKNSIVY